VTRTLLLVAGLLLLSGCQFYRVRDFSTGREYITNNWQMNENRCTGRLRLTDLKTHKEVAIQEFYQKDRMSEWEAYQELH
jgi:hypothetical protein